MLENVAALPIGWHSGIAAVFGLLVGSFLNVVIYRFPKQLKHQWTVQSHEWLHDHELDAIAPPGIIYPASHCGNCGSSIKAWQNIPVLSFVLLRGRCSSCKASISLRYPTVEILTSVLSAVAVYKLGFTPAAGFAVLLTWALVALSFIDFDHQLLPDDIVLPMLWLGLALSIVPIFAEPRSAIIGAVAGYLALWSVFQAFKLITGKEGMGYGDFKLLSLFGAWLGWQYLPQIILISTVLGSFVGIALIVTKRASQGQAIPFGPYIAMAGWLALVYGEEINHAYLSFVGL